MFLTEFTSPYNFNPRLSELYINRENNLRVQWVINLGRVFCFYRYFAYFGSEYLAYFGNEYLAYFGSEYFAYFGSYYLVYFGSEYLAYFGSEYLAYFGSEYLVQHKKLHV